MLSRSVELSFTRLGILASHHAPPDSWSTAFSNLKWAGQPLFGVGRIRFDKHHEFERQQLTFEIQCKGKKSKESQAGKKKKKAEKPKGIPANGEAFGKKTKAVAGEPHAQKTTSERASSSAVEAVPGKAPGISPPRLGVAPAPHTEGAGATPLEPLLVRPTSDLANQSTESETAGKATESQQEYLPPHKQTNSVGEKETVLHNRAETVNSAEWKRSNSPETSTQYAAKSPQLTPTSDPPASEKNEKSSAEKGTIPTSEKGDKFASEKNENLTSVKDKTPILEEDSRRTPVQDEKTTSSYTAQKHFPGRDSSSECFLPTEDDIKTLALSRGIILTIENFGPWFTATAKLKTPESKSTDQSSPGRNEKSGSRRLETNALITKMSESNKPQTERWENEKSEAVPSETETLDIEESAGLKSANENATLGKVQGFIRPWIDGQILHLDSARVVQIESEKVRTVFGVGLLLGALVIRYGFDRNCSRAELLAINDSDEYHKKLVRYYKRLGFVPVYEVEGGSLRDMGHQLVWGGVGTRMNGDLERLLKKWGKALKMG